MQSKIKFFASVLLVFSLSLGLFFAFSPKSVQATTVPEVCPEGDGWVKDDDWPDAKSTFTFNAESGKIVSEVCVKGANTREFFTTDGTKSCWNVTGIGTQSSTVSETWVDEKDSSCNDISHASFKIVDKLEEELDPLEISKTALTSYTTEWTWEISKTTEIESLELDLGEKKSIDYIVTLTPASLGSQWKVYGTITVYNPNPEAVEITDVIDIVSKDIEVIPNCGVKFPYFLASEDSLVCTYEKVLPDDSKRSNGAKVFTTISGLRAQTMVDFDFTDAIHQEIDECIYVSDDKYGELGEICANDDVSFPYEFEYSLEIEGKVCGEGEYTNTATGITNDTESEIEDSVTIETLVSGDGCIPDEEEDDEDGEILGESTTAEVKGTTTVVLASTAAGDRSSIYLIQSLLMLLTGVSLIYVGREYLNRY